MAEIEFLVRRLRGGGYSAQAQGADIFTEADSLAELRKNICEAACCHCEECSRPDAVVLRFGRHGRTERIEL